MSLLGTEASFYHHRDKGVDWVFVEHPSYHRAGGLYGDSYGVYGDNQVCSCEARPAPMGLWLDSKSQAPHLSANYCLTAHH